MESVCGHFNSREGVNPENRGVQRILGSSFISAPDKLLAPHLYAHFHWGPKEFTLGAISKISVD